jgi:hypothetical protein
MVFDESEPVVDPARNLWEQVGRVEVAEIL